MTNFEHFKQNLTIFDIVSLSCHQRCVNCPASEFCATVNNPCDETFRIWATQEYKEKKA